MKSQSPLDNVPYAVVQTFDDYSNIVAVTYDPQTQHIYWADNGRQRISRKAFGYAAIGTSSNVEVIYTDIGIKLEKFKSYRILYIFVQAEWKEWL